MTVLYHSPHIFIAWQGWSYLWLRPHRSRSHTSIVVAGFEIAWPRSGYRL